MLMCVFGLLFSPVKIFEQEDSLFPNQLNPDQCKNCL